MSISISPNPIHLRAGSSLPLKAISTFSDGLISDVTSSTVWTVDDASIVEVDQQGNALGFHAGTAQIKAESLGMVAEATAVVQPVVFTTYFSAEAGAPDSTLRISASGDGHLQSCSMVYVFNEDQQLTECCGCTVSSGGLRTLSLNQDLRSNPLTQVSPVAGSIMVVAADQGANSACDPAAISGAKAGTGWLTHTQTSGPSVYATETTLSGSDTTNEFLDSVQAQCSFVKQLGSGRGICSCGTGD
ncbi:Ig-like domain-containing protein [Occallatibacter riparius]|uniref:Ig-like domain-containing protein n=1 Tax=Occallatibacter riparius TaxID=1002689 RepID=A0A9J7BHL6_9BACT|nr:Ig-like domain-containing protein [Occallatibacter riparius]UWZ81923.1 Ig-like domain-containing protein [Occallatibacter riparius]